MLNVIFVFIVLKNIRLLIGKMDINKIVLILKVGIYIYVFIFRVGVILFVFIFLINNLMFFRIVRVRVIFSIIFWFCNFIDCI